MIGLDSLVGIPSSTYDRLPYRSHLECALQHDRVFLSCKKKECCTVSYSLLFLHWLSHPWTLAYNVSMLLSTVSITLTRRSSKAPNQILILCLNSLKPLFSSCQVPGLKASGALISLWSSTSRGVPLRPSPGWLLFPPSLSLLIVELP